MTRGPDADEPPGPTTGLGAESSPAPCDPRPSLRADCARCFALCCVVPAFNRSAEFALDKPAHQPCPHLATPTGQPSAGDDFGCTIHAELRPRGFGGCESFDCLGAGQQVAQHTFAGRSWRAHPETAELMFETFEVMRGLHELRWYLAEAVEMTAPGPLHHELVRAAERVAALTRAPGDVVASLNLGGCRADVVPLLREASQRFRAEAVRRLASRVGVTTGRPSGQDLEDRDLSERDPADRDLSGQDLSGRDLAGKDLRRHSLWATSLRGALMVGADLRGVDLTHADLTGADLRGADLRGARLHAALFVTTSQIGPCRGDASTSLPSLVERPPRWPT